MKNIFISMIGFEKRGLGFFQKKWDFNIDNFILFINREYKDFTPIKQMRSQILSKLKGKEYKILEASYRDSFELVRSFNTFVYKNKLKPSDCNFFCDISNFNRQNLLVLMWLLKQKYCVKTLDVFYTIPQKYNLQISKGVGGFFSIPFFRGSFAKEKAKLLVLLVGYEKERAQYLYETIEPSKVILAYGEQPTDKRFLSTNKKILTDLTRTIPNSETLEISANDPLRASKQLEKIFQMYRSEYNIMVSPLNTKLQAVGLYLAWEKNQYVQIVYSFPDKFSDWISIGIKKVQRFRI